MSSTIDFDALYRELGVDPNDGTATVRSAYRRRVAEIHPDRASGSDSTELQRLNGMYAAAMRFERDFGRLPGATVARPRSIPAIPDTAVKVPRNIGVSVATRENDHRRWYLLALALVLAAVALFVHSDPDVAIEADAAAGAMAVGTATSGHAPDNAAPTITIGMSVQEVLAIQGPPVATDGNRWLYGPSWLRFACLEVTDWYSSPLYALKTASAQPTAQARRMHRPAHRENCERIALP